MLNSNLFFFLLLSIFYGFFTLRALAFTPRTMESEKVETILKILWIRMNVSRFFIIVVVGYSLYMPEYRSMGWEENKRHSNGRSSPSLRIN